MRRITKAALGGLAGSALIVATTQAADGATETYSYTGALRDVLAVALPAGPAEATQSDIKVSPKEIAFGTRTVGKDYFDGVKITNTSGQTLQILVEAGLPDDFGFGFMPGSTCPVLTPGELMADGASCRAVVRFTPTDFFVGREQRGSLTVTATDPDTGAVNRTEIPVSGTGKK